MVEERDKVVETDRGPFTVRDFRGNGKDVLLVHGRGHNVEVWRPVAHRLRERFHVVAFDLRGHGQTPVESTDPEPYWRDIQPVTETLKMSDPMLVGHSTGGYAVSAHAASGGDYSSVVVIDGFVLDDRKTPEETKAYSLPRQQIWDMFRYGWKATHADHHSASIRSSTVSKKFSSVAERLSGSHATSRLIVGAVPSRSRKVTCSRSKRASEDERDARTRRYEPQDGLHLDRFLSYIRPETRLHAVVQYEIVEARAVPPREDDERFSGGIQPRASLPPPSRHAGRLIRPSAHAPASGKPLRGTPDRRVY